jgi:hypothetical protein
MRLREGITRVTNVPSMAERNGDFRRACWRGPEIRSADSLFRPAAFRISSSIPSDAPLRRCIQNQTERLRLQTMSSPTLRDNIDHFDTRVDHSLGTGSNLSVRYSFNDRRFFEPFASTVSVPGYSTDVPRRGQNLAAGLTHVFSPAVVNETRIGYSRVAIVCFRENKGQAPIVRLDCRRFPLTRATSD